MTHALYATGMEGRVHAAMWTNGKALGDTVSPIPTSVFLVCKFLRYIKVQMKLNLTKKKHKIFIHHFNVDLFGQKCKYPKKNIFKPIFLQ